MQIEVHQIFWIPKELQLLIIQLYAHQLELTFELIKFKNCIKKYLKVLEFYS